MSSTEELELTIKRLQDLIASLERSVQWRDKQKAFLRNMVKRCVEEIPVTAWKDSEFYAACRAAGGTT